MMPRFDPFEPVRRDMERIKHVLSTVKPPVLLPRWTETKKWAYHGVAYDSHLVVIDDDDFDSRPELYHLRAWTQLLHRQGKYVYRIVITGPEGYEARYGWPQLY